jgi:hypothetical protein
MIVVNDSNRIKATDIEVALAYHFNKRVNVVVPRVSWGFGINYEADVVVIRPSRYAVEIEIKVSKSDLIKDKEKNHDHDSNKFKELYFAVPWDWDNEFCYRHIPDRSGLIKIRTEGNNYWDFGIEVVRKPKINTQAERLTMSEVFHLQHMGCMKLWSALNKLRQYEQ